MEGLFLLLSFILLILSIIGLFKPSVVKQTERSKAVAYPLTAGVISLFIFTALLPPETKNNDKVQEEIEKKVKTVKVEQNSSTLKTQQVEENPVVNTSTNKELEPSKEQALEAKTNQDASLEESDMVQEYLHRQLAEEAGADYDAMQSNLQKNMELLREKYSQ